MAKSFEAVSDVFYGLLQQHKRIDRITKLIGPWGTGYSYERRLRRNGKKRCGDRLVFLGMCPYESIPALHRDFDVAVVPSHSENIGGAFEPMVMGVPTAATKVGGLPDPVIDGVTGWYHQCVLQN